jgi:hypothetical protein
MKTLSPPSSSPVSKLGGQALVLDVESTWRELTGVANKLAANLTNQVRFVSESDESRRVGRSVETDRGASQGRDSGSEEYGERHGDEAGERSRRKVTRGHDRSREVRESWEDGRMYRNVEGSIVRVWFEMQASSLRFCLLVGVLTQGQSSAIDREHDDGCCDRRSDAEDRDPS